VAVLRQQRRAGDNDPAAQEKLIKLNTLLADLVIFHNTLDIIDVIRGLVAESWTITAGQLGALSPYLRAHISRVRFLRHRRAHPPARSVQPGAKRGQLYRPDRAA
jgi:hypothetical protein